MQLWKLILAYDGTSFHGWQIQPSLPTIQGSLRTALRELTGEDPLPQGSGRTDAGVHALAQVASFPLAVPIPPANLLRALNRNLPPAIRVLSAEHVPPGFHARHSAMRKTYEYRIFPRVLSAARRLPDAICPPFLAPYVWDCPWPIDLTLANAAANQIVGTHDFRSFAASDPDQNQRNNLVAPSQTAPSFEVESPSSSTRTIYASNWTREHEIFIYRITGSGFLHHMVRNLVGTLVEVASGRVPVNAFSTILTARDRSVAGPTSPASGLFLVSVDYSNLPDAPPNPEASR